MEKIQITSAGIKTVLSKYDYRRAIAEFIWNGFDAEATSVNLIYEANEIGAISELKIVDNGYGIDRDKLSEKFKLLFESDCHCGRTKVRRGVAPLYLPTTRGGCLTFN